MLDAILVMIGYYLVILSSAMILIVAGIQIFKVLSARKQLKESEMASRVTGAPSEETGEETAAAIAVIGVMLASQERASVSAWPLVERGPYSAWKIASRSRRISPVGG